MSSLLRDGEFLNRLAALERASKSSKKSAETLWQLLEVAADMHRKNHAIAVVNQAVCCALLRLASEKTRDYVVGELTDQLAEIRPTDPDPKFREYIEAAMEETLTAICGGRRLPRH